MTFAEKFRARRQPSYDNAADLFNLILHIDPAAEVQRTDLGPVVMFSDGSQHRLGA